MARRIAFVVAAEAGDEFVSGAIDASRIFSLLTRNDYGQCIMPGSVLDASCATRYAFEEKLQDVLEAWKSTDQLIIYFSGHGEIKNGVFGLVFGKTKKTHLTYGQLADDLIKAGVTRAIVIIDACHSGAVHTTVGEKGDVTAIADFSVLPKGIAVISSCQRHEKSYELADRSGSRFTSALAEAIETGLGRTPTNDGFISLQDALDYIEKKFQHDLQPSSQKPMLSCRSADKSIWLAKNVSGKTELNPEFAKPKKNNQAGARTYDELKVLYELTAPSHRPCPGPSFRDLSIPVMETYAARANLTLSDTVEASAREFGFYSALSPTDLTRAAVLCFTESPQKHFQQARAVLLVGSRESDEADRTDVVGPLGDQVASLVNHIERWLTRIAPIQATELSTLRLRVIREAVSNAIVHRSYEEQMHVQISINAERIVIRNPGALLKGRTWAETIKSNGVSIPNDAAIAWYLTNLLQFEGVGRGFSKYREYLAKVGESSITCVETTSPPSVELTIWAPKSKPSVPPLFDDTRTIFPSQNNEPNGDDGQTNTILPDSIIKFPDTRWTLVDVTRGADNTDVSLMRGTIMSHYQIEKVLGRGGQATVYLATDTRLNRPVAIKVLSRRFVSSDSRKRFGREARAVAQLTHRNIIPIFDIGTDGDNEFIVMQFVDGKTISEWVKIIPQNERREECVRLIVEIASALQHAHSAGLVHRDVKPSNILVTSDGVPMLLDFGIARLWDSDETLVSLTTTGGVIGTLAYMSPEQSVGRASDPRSDIYSLGIVLIELLSGERCSSSVGLLDRLHLHSDGAIPGTNANGNLISEELRSACIKSTALDPNNRYQTAEEFAADLQRCIHKLGLPQSTHPALSGFLKVLVNKVRMLFVPRRRPKA